LESNPNFIIMQIKLFYEVRRQLNQNSQTQWKF